MFRKNLTLAATFGGLCLCAMLGGCGGSSTSTPDGREIKQRPPAAAPIEPPNLSPSGDQRPR